MNPSQMTSFLNRTSRAEARRSFRRILCSNTSQRELWLGSGTSSGSGEKWSGFRHSCKVEPLRFAGDWNRAVTDGT